MLWLGMVPIDSCVCTSLCEGLNVPNPGGRTIEICCLDGIDVALLEEVCPCGVGFETLLPALLEPVCSWLPLDEDVEPSAPPVTSLPGCYSA